MSLNSFYSYCEEIIESNNAAFLIELKKKDDEIFIEKVDKNPSEKIDDNREKFLKFFIISENVEISKSKIYSDDFAPLVIVGEGGRLKKDCIERINLRVLSKAPEKKTMKIFNALKNKLKKDTNIGMGVKGNSKVHENYFFQKEIVEKKVFKTDFYNDKSPVIEPV